MCGKFNKQLGGIVTVSQPIDKGVQNGIHLFSINVFLNGNYIDGAWGDLVTLNQWLVEKNYV